VRNHHDQGFMEAAWTHLRTAPAPFGELTWTRARQILASRGSDPVTEADIAAAAADLLDRAGNGPSGQTPVQQQAAGRTRSPRSRRVAGRTAATAAPQWPRPAPVMTDTGEDEDPAGQPGVRDPAKQPGRQRAEAGTAPAQVIPLPLFDARKEAEKWW
jgi:hypothetical protein